MENKDCMMDPFNAQIKGVSSALQKRRNWSLF
jgi:hypothetical protein